MNLLNVKRTFIKVIEKLKAHDTKIGNTTMGTTATTLTGAIAEHEGDISNLNSKFVYVDYGSTAFQITTGNAGTYSSAIDIDISKTGYEAMAWSIKAINHPAGYFVVLERINVNTMRVLIYRANNLNQASNYDANDFMLRVLYMKS